LWDTIPQLVDDAAKRFGATEAISDGETRLTFLELSERIHRATRALIGSGIEPGDCVAIWAPNLIEWVICALAVHGAGAVLVPINTRFKGSEAAYVLRRSKARLLFTVSDFLGTDYVAMLDDQNLGNLEEIIVLRGPASGVAVPIDELLLRAERVTERERQDRGAAVKRHDLCHILFTSGTTGVPKGVLLEHGAVCDVYLDVSKVFDMQHGDRQLVVLPFFHSFGLHVGILCSLMAGVTILPHLVFDTEAVIRRVAEDHVTLFPGPPTIFQTMIQSPLTKELDISSLRSVTVGSAGFPPTLVEDIQRCLGVDRVQSGYGLTESSGTVSLCSPPDSPEVITNTVGRPLPGIEVRIADEENDELPRGEPGEVLVRGYAVMRGYLDEPDETARVIDADGWLHTGDIGLIREDGNLVITDRKKDMYSVGGFNAYPAEIEAMLARHPAIAQVAVIGVPDQRLGEVGMAFVVPAPGVEADPDEIIAWAREAMANYKAPRYVEIVAELPLNATGKVLKPALRADAAERFAAHPEPALPPRTDRG